DGSRGGRRTRGGGRHGRLRPGVAGGARRLHLDVRRLRRRLQLRCLLRPDGRRARLGAGGHVARVLDHRLPLVHPRGGERPGGRPVRAPPGPAHGGGRDGHRPAAHVAGRLDRGGLRHLRRGGGGRRRLRLRAHGRRGRWLVRAPAQHRPRRRGGRGGPRHGGGRAGGGPPHRPVRLAYWLRRPRSGQHGAAPPGRRPGRATTPPRCLGQGPLPAPGGAHPRLRLALLLGRAALARAVPGVRLPARLRRGRRGVGGRGRRPRRRGGCSEHRRAPRARSCGRQGRAHQDVPPVLPRDGPLLRHLARRAQLRLARRLRGGHGGRLRRLRGALAGGGGRGVRRHRAGPVDRGPVHRRRARCAGRAAPGGPRDRRPRVPVGHRRLDGGRPRRRPRPRPAGRQRRRRGATPPV
ncbi:MAG: hypothetical protein AVDCRST_MAG20-2222, partial [uncultured Acidimicrobiales bacterium]